MKFEMLDVAVVSPKLKVADVKYNVNEMKKVIDSFEGNWPEVILFPELSITGYTCADLFFQEIFYSSIEKELSGFLAYLCEIKCNALIAVGAPVRVNEKLFNCAIIIAGGEVIDVVAKTYLPNTNEFYEKRWFTSSHDHEDEVVYSHSLECIYNNTQFFKNKSLYRLGKAIIGIEICEDLWSVIPPSSQMAINGANVILNLSTSNELVGKSNYRNNLVKGQSERLVSAYLYASSGVHESTTDVVFGGDCMVVENGKLLARNDRFHRETTVVRTQIDIDMLNQERIKNKTYADSTTFAKNPRFKWEVIDIGSKARTGHDKSDSNLTKLSDFKLQRKVSTTPFVPTNRKDLKAVCEEIFSIQTAGLAKRIEHIGEPTIVIGISGGLDSTLALLVAVRTMKLLKRDMKDIIGVTMPAYGTTSRTLENSRKLMNLLGITAMEVNVTSACDHHLADIDHVVKNDITFENAQARERTQVLMDLANKFKGIVLGTGDLSELAMGWCTYNGDHMSMYAVNSSIPKTLVRFLVGQETLNFEGQELQIVLADILDTPVSPELFELQNDEIHQKTEDIIGPYILHDFFLYYLVRYGFRPAKIFALASSNFEEYSDQEIMKWMKKFYWRFFSQQFKRSCIPDGPKVGSVNLSPRGDWRMPSDAMWSLWKDELAYMESLL